jgi:hypothetical protein
MAKPPGTPRNGRRRAVGSVGNPRPHEVGARGSPGGRGLSKRLWAARSAVQGDGGQVVGSALASVARLARAPPGAVHELSTGAVSRGTVHSPSRRGAEARRRCGGLHFNLVDTL